ncbi:MAG: fibronectin type III domain-containing protein [Flavobacteriales bacterium]|nr:fibronectin type III domain-containing protein [Flavobacteriales bacterium]
MALIGHTAEMGVYPPYDGAVKLRWSGEKAARYYQLQKKKEDESWELVATTTRTTHTLNGFLSGQVVTVRVIAIGSAGASNPSESVNAKAA